MFATWAIGVVGPLLFGKATSCKFLVEVNQKPFLEFDLSGLNRYDFAYACIFIQHLFAIMFIHVVLVVRMFLRA